MQLNMASDIAEALHYLHCCSFVVGTLAARGVLVGRDYTCKIASFGLDRDADDRSNAVTTVATAWAALELLPRVEGEATVTAGWRLSTDSGVELPPGAMPEVRSPRVSDSTLPGLLKSTDTSADNNPGPSSSCYTQSVHRAPYPMQSADHAPFHP